MALAASWTLARGWWRSMRGWWVATALTLALVQVLLMSVAAVFSGMEQETDERIEAFYTGDVRITRDRPAAAPDVYWTGDEVGNATAALGAGGGTVLARLESQFVLSRRTLVEAYLEEQEQYRVRTPGGAQEGQDFYSIGILVGLDLHEADAADSVRPYLLPGGRLPQRTDDVVEIMMSLDAFAQYVGDARTDFTDWPPRSAELGTIRFEVTTARIDPHSTLKDLIRFPARVVGLFETGVDAVDTFTLVTHRSSVQRLLGFDAEMDVANVFTVTGGPGASDRAGQEGWTAEDASAFSGRYIGQLVGVVKSLSLFLTALFVTVPLFLVWHGLSQLLQMYHREYAVCRAIGVPVRVLGGGFVALVGALLLAAAAVAAVLVAIAPALLDPLLQGALDLPLPVRYHLTPRSVWLTLAMAGVAMAVAVLAAVRRLLATDLASALRAG